jgi:hypothetical protein
MKKSEFEQIVEKAFRGLESKYGFKKGETLYSKKGCTVQFVNTTTDVTLHYEIGSDPWLAIADIHDPENKSTLEWLLVERGVEKTPTPAQAFRSTPTPAGDLASLLEKKNQQLIEYGTELIKGDFSLMPALKKRAKKYALDCDRYLTLHQSKK